ncbi:hypothetical protein AXG93_1384s1000 [Marchantia polymorpha subsp. ruderalis]|uniref:Uncharacterized protein n=1 Tax=Marchantia polymorpha subsp. ruderalis TaxID=1480154 RepID=A0A176VQ05_MARPO|nr:hypothetical protein AXG93_1384s1000 [Marchantia polymorpha subsp. ruderalis]
MVVESHEISLPQMSAGMVRLKGERRSSEEEMKQLVVAFSDFMQDSIVPLLKYLDGKQKKYAILKESGFYVELIRSRTHIKQAAVVKTAGEMKRECAEATAKEREEQLQANKMEYKVLRLNLAKEKKLRMEEKLRSKDLRREIVAMKIKRMELRKSIGSRTEAHNKELQCANELSLSLAEHMKKHEVELAS